MTIFKHTLKRIFSSKIKLLIIFLCPILFTAMFVTTTTASLTLLVADRDHSALSGRLAAGLGTMGGKVLAVDESQIDDKILSYQADIAIVIPAGFEDAILAGQIPTVEAFHILDKEGNYYVQAYVDGFVADIRSMAAGAGYDRAGFEAALAQYDRQALTVRELADESGPKPWTSGSLGFLVQFMLYMSIITAGVILEDRSSGVYYRTFFAPVSLKRYFAENLLAFLLIGIVQAALSITMMITVFGIHYPSPPAIYALFIVFALVCVALGMWLITLFKKPLMAYLSILFISTPLVMLGGCYWPQSYMPDTIVKIAKFMPTTWVMQGVDKVINQGANLGGVGLEILMLLIFAGIFMAAGLVRKIDIAK